MRNLVIISLDCVRREALGCYGLPFPFWFHRGIPPLRMRGAGRLRPLYEPLLSPVLHLLAARNTPNIDSVAAQGAIFTQAVTQAPYTSASHASVFTGLNPFSHGIRRFVGYKLNPCALTLAEKLKAHGFKTGAFVGSNALGHFYGFDRGFDIYDFTPRESIWRIGAMNLSRRSHEEVTENALRWLGGVSGRFFLFLHYFDVHETSKSPFTYQPIFQCLKMSDVDRSIGRVIKALKERGCFEETAFFILADHGNDFGVHEPGHREYLYDTTLIVPLIISAGETAPKRLTPQVRLIDLFPTASEVLGLPIENPPPYRQPEGRSLLPLLRGEAFEELPAYSETFIELSSEEFDRPGKSYMSLRDGRWKVVVDRVSGEKRLFDLSNDPEERTDVYARERDAGERLLKEIEDISSGPDPEVRAMDEMEISATLESLKALGYL